MLRLLKNTTVLTAIHRISDIIQNVKIVFETSATRLLEALCDVSDRNTRNGSGEKIPFDPEHRNKIANNLFIKLLKTFAKDVAHRYGCWAKYTEVKWNYDYNIPRT